MMANESRNGAALRSVRQHLIHSQSERRRSYACRAKTPEEFERWRTSAVKAYRDLLGLTSIAENSTAADQDESGYGDIEFHRADAVAELSGNSEDKGIYIRRRGWIETERHVRIQFYILIPKSKGPFPLAVTPHGHENGDTYAGIWHNEQERRQIEHEDQDVAVQAVKRGFLTIAPATRGIYANPKSFRIEADAHGGRRDIGCQMHNWQSVVAGRTLLGERVWDLKKILDWALQLPDVRSDAVLMAGNSGGGMATLHAAAADERITVAVPCCAFNNYIDPAGMLRHCRCNAIPGILEFGEYWDVAGLVAPRRLLTVNGRDDALHPVGEVDHAVGELKRIYGAAGVPDRYEHLYGDGGHRFYADLMWPWIERALTGREMI